MGCCISPEKEILSYELNLQHRKGIPNIGNTCYMNSVIQALAGTKDFLNILNTPNRSELISLKNLIQALYGKDETLSILAKDFKDKISKSYSTFEGSRQNDAKELLVIILSILDEVRNPFNISYKKSFKCSKEHLFMKDEISNLIVIPSKIETGITRYLEEMNRPKAFKGENKLFCLTCNELRDTIMETVSIDCSDFMVLYLARSEGEENNINCERDIMFQNFQYSLYAVICHGSALKHFYECEINYENSWYKYNDSKTSLKRNFANSKAYLLFYRRIR